MRKCVCAVYAELLVYCLDFSPYSVDFQTWNTLREMPIATHADRSLLCEDGLIVDVHADDGLDGGERRWVDALAAEERGQLGGARVVERAERVLRLGTLERSGGVDLAGCDATPSSSRKKMASATSSSECSHAGLGWSGASPSSSRSVYMFVIKKRSTALSSSREVTSSVMPTMSKPASSAVVGGVAIARIVDEGVTVRQ